MTRHLTTANLSDFITSLTPFTVGMDRMFRDLEQFSNSYTASSTGYPPYNIEQVDDGKWVISMAVAGFGEDPRGRGLTGQYAPQQSGALVAKSVFSARVGA